MILRRFMQHVKEQNWFAVGLDVIVVIVGIFLGLQVQAWYEEQADRALERDYLTKLHADTAQLINDTDEYVARINNIQQWMGEFSQMLIDDHDGSDFKQLHCNALAYSHIYTTRIISLPTLNELLSSGQILLITDEEIRTLLSRFTMENDRTMILQSSLQADKLDFLREYTDIIDVNTLGVGDTPMFENLEIDCDFETMSNSKQFKNHLISSHARYRGFTGTVNLQFSMLNELHAALSQELGVIH